MNSRLQPILVDAERREQDAAAALTACRQRHAAQAARLEQLGQYRAEYTSTLRARGEQGMAVRELRDYGAFLTRLGAAMDVEARALQRLDAELAERLQAWQATLTRARSLAKALERERTAWVRRQGRREQAAADEHATQAGIRSPLR